MADSSTVGQWPPQDAGGWPHQPGGTCPHCQVLGIDFGEDEPGPDDDVTNYPPSASGNITPGHLSGFDPWASR